MSTNIQSPFSPGSGVSNPVTIAQGGTGAVTASAALTALGGLVLQATTGTAGFALQNGTPNIITWTTPNDGALHRFTTFGAMQVTVTEVGGAIAESFTTPDGTAVASWGLWSGSQGTGFNFSQSSKLTLVQANTTVTVFQSSALTSGTAKVWVEIWGL